jgi:hypothetical protein
MGMMMRPTHRPFHQLNKAWRSCRFSTERHAAQTTQCDGSFEFVGSRAPSHTSHPIPLGLRRRRRRHRSAASSRDISPRSHFENSPERKFLNTTPPFHRHTAKPTAGSSSNTSAIFTSPPALLLRGPQRSSVAGAHKRRSSITLDKRRSCEAPQSPVTSNTPIWKTEKGGRRRRFT